MASTMPSSHKQAFTRYGWLVCSWILVTAFQYGYHISVLNQIQEVLTCGTASNIKPETCIPMSEFTFSVITAVFTAGGLIGSLVANIVMDRKGRKVATVIANFLIASGAGLMSVSSSVELLGIGRFLIGVGSGIGICVGPVFLSEISPAAIRGNVGVLTQLGIVLGIMVTQSMGLRFATPTEWRTVLYFSCALSTFQAIASKFVVESPSWLGARGRLEHKVFAASKLWVLNTSAIHTTQDSRSTEPLLDELEAHREENNVMTVTTPELFVARELRKPLAIVCLAMASQQLSGINAVLYFSNAILSKTLPDFGPHVSLGITIINVIMTFPPILLIERFGRRQLLILSTAGAVISLFTIGFGLNTGKAILSSFAIVIFVMSFATGLGPIPFVMISEVSPPHAVSSLSSMALSLNWIVNFFVGLVFLPLRKLLSGGDAQKEGRVFYVFGVVLFLFSSILFRLYTGRS